MSDTKVIDTKMALAWMAPLSITIIGALVSLVWMSAKQDSKIEKLLEQQAKIEQQQAARDLRDETYRTAQSNVISGIQLNDSRQDLRIESLEKWRSQMQPQPLGRWTR